MITNFPNGISSFGVPLTGGSQLVDMSGTVYFVDGNSGSDGNDGLSWDYPKKTVAAALVVSHADIARGSDRWARRNTVFIAGDRFTENLVLGAQKTDLIGVGSCDSYKRAGIRGNHTMANNCSGMRFINIQFEPAASSDIVTQASTASGIEFWNCNFLAAFGAYTAPSAIQSTASPLLKIMHCTFEGAFSGDVIDIAAGDASGTQIVGNEIRGGANDGIVISGVATVSGISSRGLIADNYIQVAAKTIDTRAVSVFNVYNNRCISAAALGGDSYVIDPTFACGNIITGADASASVPNLLVRTT